MSEALREASFVGLPISEDGEDEEDEEGWDNFEDNHFIDSTNKEYVEPELDYVNPEISAEPDNPEVQEPQGQIEEFKWEQGNTSEEPDWQEEQHHQTQFKEPDRIQAEENNDTLETKPAVKMDWRGSLSALTERLIGYELRLLMSMLGDYSPTDLRTPDIDH